MRHGRIAMLGIMLSWGAGGAAWAVSCAGSDLAYAETGNTDMNFPLCSFRSCQLPTSATPVYTFGNPGCDPSPPPPTTPRASLSASILPDTAPPT